MSARRQLQALVRRRGSLHSRPRLRASRYRPSPRPYPDPLPAIEYPGHFLVREITAAGTFRFGDRLLFLSNALRHYPVGLEEAADGIWSVYFCHVLLARIDERTGTLNRG